MTAGQATRDFISELDAEWLEMMGGIRDAVIYIATEGLARVTEKSPVDVGTFQNNWLVSIGAPSEATTMTLGEFARLSAQAIASYATADGFPMIYLQNNLPYALRLENGWSAQAPSGVLAMTVAELEQIWQGMPSP
ncbi:hypothetical protein ACFSDD_11035 [Salipiger marinus]|uniref:hypothetical protein n=1 Tax=Salipiger marinus TaxID=555512 RepID=UPI002B7F38CD|nr:hypothetical protein [Salipiger manganoxidans]MEB3419905.1 hypothetical protein [Salipiger manganoxidans]